MLDNHTQAGGLEEDNLPVEFKFEDHRVRAFTGHGGIRFIADDACKALGHTDTSKAVSRLDDDEKGTNIVRTLGGDQTLLTVTESGLYNLIFTSRLPKAKGLSGNNRFVYVAFFDGAIV
jgi:prophage antirepressor-like protein